MPKPRFHLPTVSNIVLVSFTLCRTLSLLILSTQLIFSILLQIHKLPLLNSRTFKDGNRDGNVSESSISKPQQHPHEQLGKPDEERVSLHFVQTEANTYTEKQAQVTEDVCKAPQSFTVSISHIFTVLQYSRPNNLFYPYSEVVRQTLWQTHF